LAKFCIVVPGVWYERGAGEVPGFCQSGFRSSPGKDGCEEQFSRAYGTLRVVSSLPATEVAGYSQGIPCVTPSAHQS